MIHLLLPYCLGEDQINNIKTRLPGSDTSIYVAAETRKAYREALAAARESSGRMVCVCCPRKHDVVAPRMRELGIEYTFIPLENLKCTKGAMPSTVDMNRLIKAVNGKR